MFLFVHKYDCKTITKECTQNLKQFKEFTLFVHCKEKKTWFRSTFLTLLRASLIWLLWVLSTMVFGESCHKPIIFYVKDMEAKSTVHNNRVLTKPGLCSKLSLFEMSLQILEVLQKLSPLDLSLPYLRALQ